MGSRNVHQVADLLDRMAFVAQPNSLVGMTLIFGRTHFFFSR